MGAGGRGRRGAAAASGQRGPHRCQPLHGSQEVEADVIRKRKYISEEKKRRWRQLVFRNVCASVHGKHKHARTLILQVYTRTHDPPPPQPPLLPY